MNKIILIGNLTRDPETRSTQAGKTVCNFTLAVNRARKVEGQPDADFFTINAWGKLGESCQQYLQKGRKVCAWGAVSIQNYEDKDGNKRTSVSVMADHVEFLSPKQQPEGGTTGPYSGFTQADEEELPF